MNEYQIVNRISGIEFDSETEKDNLRDLANQVLSYIESSGFSTIKEVRLEEEGLYILACALRQNTGDRIKTFKFN